MEGQSKPPVFVSGGRRLNFDRRDQIGETFLGSGKDDGCFPSGSWEELCAMAKLIVDHPAFRLPETVNTYSPPTIEDEDESDFEAPGA